MSKENGSVDRLSPMNFDEEDIAIPVRIRGETYELREASGEAGCNFRNEIARRVTLGPEGKPQRIGNLADVEPKLISACLFDKDGKNVPEKTVRSWPNRIQKALFKRIQEISDLDEDAEDPAKNEPADTTDG